MSVVGSLPLSAAPPCASSRLRSHAPARALRPQPAPPCSRVRPSRRLRARAAALPGDDEAPAAPRDVRRLERLFERTVDAAPVLSQPLSPAPRRATPPGTLPPLLLWRVPWTMLPGFREMLHVHAPPSVALFDQVLAGPRPWRYAHLYTPDEGAPPRRRNDPPGDDDAEGGSDDATEGGDSENEEPPQASPVHAVLMDVVAAERTADGRLYMVVRALSRLRVRGSVGSTPGGSPLFACELAPDVEETQAYAPLAHVAARRAAADAGGGADAAKVARAASRAAAAAAAAAALTWQAYFESASAARDFARMQARVVALAKAFFELADVGAPPAAPLAEVAAASIAAARAAAAAAAAAALSEPEAAAEAGESELLGFVGWRFVAADDVAAQAGPPAAEALPVELAMAEADMWAQYDVAVALQRALSPGGVGTGAGGGSLARALPRARPPYAARVLRPLAPPAAAAALARLRPSPAPLGDGETASGGPSGDAARAPAPPPRPVPPPWPALRRASRASFALACVLPELSRGAGRQALLDTPGAAERLKAVTRVLAARRATLAALNAVENARGVGGPDDGAE